MWYDNEVAETPQHYNMITHIRNQAEVMHWKDRPPISKRLETFCHAYMEMLRHSYLKL